ncbi:MAG: NAD(P)H-dependent glycerol-3-phosphate dehydrogenase, partial [bacterium]
VMTVLGADPALADGLAGLGDLLATGWSESSFNHRIGKAIGREGSSEEMSGEGVKSLGEIHAVLNIDEFPVLETLRRIVIEREDPRLLESLLG